MVESKLIEFKIIHKLEIYTEADRQTLDRQTDRQTDRHTHTHCTRFWINHLFYRYPNSLGRHNYCRNPEPTNATSPWCYNGEGEDPRWEYCDISDCNSLTGKRTFIPGSIPVYWGSYNKSVGIYNTLEISESLESNWTVPKQYRNSFRALNL